jgi:hypothetical protein
VRFVSTNCHRLPGGLTNLKSRSNIIDSMAAFAARLRAQTSLWSTSTALDDPREFLRKQGPVGCKVQGPNYLLKNCTYLRYQGHSAGAHYSRSQGHSCGAHEQPKWHPRSSNVHGTLSFSGKKGNNEFYRLEIRKEAHHYARMCVTLLLSFECGMCSSSGGHCRLP